MHILKGEKKLSSRKERKSRKHLVSENEIGIREGGGGESSNFETIIRFHEERRGMLHTHTYARVNKIQFDSGTFLVILSCDAEANERFKTFRLFECYSRNYIEHQFPERRKTNSEFFFSVSEKRDDLRSHHPSPLHPCVEKARKEWKEEGTMPLEERKRRMYISRSLCTKVNDIKEEEKGNEATNSKYVSVYLIVLGAWDMVRDESLCSFFLFLVQFFRHTISFSLVEHSCFFLPFLEKVQDE